MVDGKKVMLFWHQNYPYFCKKKNESGKNLR